MKKLLFLSSAITSFFLPKLAFADITIKPPAGKGYNQLGDFISNFLIIAFSIAVIMVLVMLIWGAFDWIMSGGDKENVGKARGRIINALIGLAVLAIAFALATVAGQFLGINITNLPVPTPPPN